MATAKYALALSLVLNATAFSWTAQEKDDPTVYNEEMKIIRFDDLDYPAGAQRAGVEGFVVVNATLGDRGQVTSATALSGPKQLIPETLENARRWRFEPNRLNRVILIYRFALVDRCAPGTVRSVFGWDGPGQNVASIRACRVAP